MNKAIKGWWSGLGRWWLGRGWDEYFIRCNKHALNLYQTQLDELDAAHRLSTAWLRREVEGLSKETAEMEKGLGK